MDELESAFSDIRHRAVAPVIAAAINVHKATAHFTPLQDLPGLRLGDSWAHNLSEAHDNVIEGRRRVTWVKGEIPGTRNKGYAQGAT